METLLKVFPKRKNSSFVEVPADSFAHYFLRQHIRSKICCLMSDTWHKVQSHIELRDYSTAFSAMTIYDW